MRFIKNKKCILPIFVILIIFGISFFVCKNVLNFNNNIILDEVKLKSLSDNTNAFAIMIGDTEGNYTKYESTQLPLKKDGFLFNPDKSLCVDQDGNKTKAEFKYRNDVVKAKVEEASLCYLYFDEISKEDFCIDRGITNLHDCLLVIENYSYDTEEAIAYIEDKGSATTSEPSPTTTFVEKYEATEDLENGLNQYSDKIVMGPNYEFDATTQQYTVKDTITDYIQDNYIEYYTCGSQTTCTTMYKILGYKVDETTSNYIITKADVYTNEEVVADISEDGLYSTNDEDGATYFYRGAVENNYVSYAGFIWRVIRINGDGSIRMIYSGTSTDDTGADTSIGTSAINTETRDPKFLGYTYGSNTVETITKTTRSIGDTNYYFGEGITKNEDGTYMLDQDKSIIYGHWEDLHEEVIANNPYTCLLYGSKQDSKCVVIYKFYEYVSSVSGNATYYSLASAGDYQSSLKSDIDSLIKMTIDTWYEQNILNKTDNSERLLSNYLHDSTFCNDRSFYEGDGYSLSENIFYGFKSRILGVPDFSCVQNSDKFSVHNNNLKYPIGLITADELLYAGITNRNNSLLNYLTTGQDYWTMTPYHYLSSYNISYNSVALKSGRISSVAVNGKNGVRPVINLSNKVKITEGIGTKEKPYIVTID